MGIATALRGIPILFALAACATVPPPPTESEPSPPTAETAATAPTPDITVEPLRSAPQAAPPAPSVPAPSAPTPPEQTAALPPKPKPAPVDDNPKQLFGLSGQRVAALLGPANFVRRDGTAEVWQYRAVDCVLDVFLYRRDAALSVTYVDLRQRGTSVEPPRRCFAGLLRRQL